VVKVLKTIKPRAVLDIPPDIVVSDNNIGDNITYKKIFAKESLPIILDY
jgi:hypothetical protein